ncbi:MAG TPA: hypothetical protein PKV73_01365 [Agriterribacter sp.]|nr:hypothetical protein [Agriterribacter sp.]
MKNKIEKHRLEMVRWGVIPIVNYRGMLVEKTKSGYKIFKRELETPQDVDKAIDDALGWLGMKMGDEKKKK